MDVHTNIRNYVSEALRMSTLASAAAFAAAAFSTTHFSAAALACASAFALASAAALDSAAAFQMRQVSHKVNYPNECMHIQKSRVCST